MDVSGAFFARRGHRDLGSKRLARVPAAIASERAIYQAETRKGPEGVDPVGANAAGSHALCLHAQLSSRQPAEQHWHDRAGERLVLVDRDVLTVSSEELESTKVL